MLGNSKYNKKVNAWCMYDWANSVYSLVITTAIFPIFYNSVTTSVSGSDIVNFFGLEIVNSVLYSYSLSFSFLILTIILYVLASVGFTGSLVFYNAFLPEISTPDNFDKISARGYSFGYVGSVILLIICLIIIQGFEFFGFESSKEATKFTFLLVGIWWILFAQITLHYLEEKPKKIILNKTILTYGAKELFKVWNYIKGVKNLKLYLLSYFFYSMGVQTIMLVASYFGDKEINLDQNKLIFTILIIQLIAIFGAYFFAYVSRLRGNKFSLITMNICWIIVCITAYYVTDETKFYILAAAVGILMGGIQSLSRSTFSKLLPKEIGDTASFFNFYGISYNISVVIGTFSYGYIEQVTGSMRSSVLALTLFFILGLTFLIFTKIKK